MSLYHHIDHTDPENSIEFCLMGIHILFAFFYKLQDGQGAKCKIKKGPNYGNLTSNLYLL